MLELLTNYCQDWTRLASGLRTYEEEQKGFRLRLEGERKRATLHRIANQMGLRNCGSYKGRIRAGSRGGGRIRGRSISKAGFVEWVGKRISKTDQRLHQAVENAVKENVQPFVQAAQELAKESGAIEMEVSLGLVMAGEVGPRWRKDA